MYQLEGEPPLAEDDEVEFSKIHNLALNLQLATDLRVVSRSNPKREMGQVVLLVPHIGLKIIIANLALLIWNVLTCQKCKS